MSFFDSEATRSTLTSVSTTLSANINASQDYIPVTSTSGFSTSVDAEIETTNEVVSFETITENFYQYSEEFDQGYWQKNNSAVNATGAVAPDGTSTAQGIREDSATSAHNIIRNSLTTVSGRKYVISVFAKWTGQRYLQIGTGAGDVATDPHQNFDIENGVLGSSAGTITGTITDVGNGWYRCSVVVTSQVTTGFIPVYSLITSTTSGRAQNYTGQGTSAGDMLLLWGAQFEEEDSITGYLRSGATAPTFGLTTVTRGVKGTTAQAASSGDAIQQLPFAFQKVTAGVSTTTTEAINATQDYIPVTSTSGFSTGVATTVAGTNEQFSFADISENLIPRSENIINTSGAWTSTRTTVTKGVTAPDGSSNASSVIPTVDNNTHRLDAFLSSGGSGTNNGLMVTGQTYTASIFAKAAGYDFMNLTLDETSNNPISNTAVFNLSTGTIASTGAGITSSISDEGGGWYRCSITRAFTMKSDPFSNRVLIGVMTSSTTVSYIGDTISGIHVWGGQLEKSNSRSTYLPTTSSALQGFTLVTRGINGTTAQSALSGVTVSQAASFTTVDAPIRLYALSVCSDGGGAGRLTLCDQNGDSLCDVDFPDDKIYDLDFGGGIVFPNGIYVSNTDNLTSYTLFTDKIKGGNLTPGG